VSIELEGETLATTHSSETVETRPSIPMLTVLSHPDPSRVGECLALRALSIGQDVLLSRVEPDFSRPDDGTGSEASEGGPLGGRFLSRQPIRLRRAEASGVQIDLSTTHTSLEVEGEPLEGQRTFSAEEVAAGVVLRLARKIVLLLHQGPLPSGGDPEIPSFGLVGAGLTLRSLRQEIHKLAPLEVPVLLRGETGTGKELVARALHDGSHRKNGPFVAVNMAVLGPSLAAAALFGAERGAYTGADRNRAGHFESARGGTLFLDEIGEAPHEVQAMLLRALETRQIQPVGSSSFTEVDVRIVAATDARLEEAMAEGRFKAPLYHRLGGYTLYLPPLRKRREDLGRLLYFFLRDELEKLGRPPLGESERPWPPAELVARLALHSWPGNVRELRNVARRLAITGRDGPIPTLDLLLPSLSGEEA
jgi:two-component system nitrogen regulation response regulator GlnG